MGVDCVRTGQRAGLALGAGQGNAAGPMIALRSICLLLLLSLFCGEARNCPSPAILSDRRARRVSGFVAAGQRSGFASASGARRRCRGLSLAFRAFCRGARRKKPHRPAPAQREVLARPAAHIVPPLRRRRQFREAGRTQISRRKCSLCQSARPVGRCPGQP